MSANYEVLLAPTTSAVASNVFSIGSRPRTIVATGLAGTEKATLQITYDGTNFVDVYFDNALVALTATNTTVVVVGPGHYRVNKEDSVSASGIYSTWVNA